MRRIRVVCVGTGLVVRRSGPDGQVVIQFRGLHRSGQNITNT